jgi:hypothetical protein
MKMNRKAIKYIVTSLVVIGCLSTIPKITTANTSSYPINTLSSSNAYVHNDNKNEDKNKHKGFNLFSDENSKYLSSDQKKDLLKIKKCKDNGDTLSKEQEENLQSIIDCIIKGKLGDKNYEEFNVLMKKKKSNETLTEKEDKQLKEYRAIIDGSKLSTKEILNQFLR